MSNKLRPLKEVTIGLVAGLSMLAAIASFLMVLFCLVKLFLSAFETVRTVDPDNTALSSMGNWSACLLAFFAIGIGAARSVIWVSRFEKSDQHGLPHAQRHSKLYRTWMKPARMFVRMLTSQEQDFSHNAKPLTSPDDID